MGKFIDLTGQRFGRLTVICKNSNTTPSKKIQWHCKCDCGNECDVFGCYLRNGDTKSCGCLIKDTVAQRNKSNLKSNEYKVLNDCIIAKTNGGIEFFIDKDDEWVLKDYCWVVNNSGYISTIKRGSREHFLLHRLLLNVGNGFVVDHINGDKLDNRKSNLRIVTQSQNCMNRKMQSNNTSGYAGIYFNKSDCKYSSFIGIDGKYMYLGYFDNFEDAVAARKSAEEKYFGEYSYDNSRNKITIDTNSDRVVETCEAHDHLIYT